MGWPPACGLHRQIGRPGAEAARQSDADSLFVVRIPPSPIPNFKATLIYPRTKNLRAVQLLLGHTKLESTVRYPGVEVDDALEMAEQTEI
jgi:site-specific recombinase XerC